ncbi:hypothetical protein [Terasakiella sp.]|uniref:hypothetical protein n=1 Tax=Terasakiella sp. TaxID=2034861 RepID=UPI003AA9C9DD
MKFQISFIGAVFVLLMSSAMAAEEWGIEGEKTDRFEAKVVDVACELSGNCPDQCGKGKRQLGLLKDDGTLVLAIKNFDIFAGTGKDLIEFCNQRVIADGLSITNDKVNMFALQFVRAAPDGEWRRANAFIPAWQKVNPNKNGAEWYRYDEMVKKEIEARGVFGIPGLKGDE